MQVWLLSK